MKKHLLFLILIILILACTFSLISCTPHQHNFESDWSSNDTHHWHNCVECDKKDSYEKHKFTNGICICGKAHPNGTQGLTYELNEDNNSYKITGIGTATYSSIAIASTYNDRPVTAIGDYAFYDSPRIKNIIIPDSITSIGQNAFQGCLIESVSAPIYAMYYIPRTNLKEINITSGSTIVDFAFYNCASLTDVKMPDSITSIGYCAFSGCVNLSNINLPKNLQIIDRGAFYSCGLTNITIPQSVISIGNSAFGDCVNMTSVIIESSATKIGENAFSGCDKLTEIVVAGVKNEGIPLSGKEALSILQKGFDDAYQKSLDKNIKISGIDLYMGTLGGIKINNIDIDIDKKYSGNEIKYNLVLRNIQIELYGQLKSTFPTIMSSLFSINIDNTTIANLSKIRFEVELKYDKTWLKLTNLTVYGLNEVKDSKGNQLSILKDGDGNPLGAVYRPGEIKLNDKISDLLYPLGIYSDDDRLDEKVKNFIDDNYTSISLFDFSTVSVNATGNKITSNTDAEFNRIFDIIQDLVDGYRNSYADYEENYLIGKDIIEPILGTTNIKFGISEFLDFGKANMNMDLKWSHNDMVWKINKMEISDTMRLTISSKTILTIFNTVIPKCIPNFELPSFLNSIVEEIVANGGIATDINISVTTTFSY